MATITKVGSETKGAMTTEMSVASVVKAGFGIPAGTAFGLRDIQLINDSRAWLMTGGFGE